MSVNPYKAPTSTVTHQAEVGLQWSGTSPIYSARGRIGRLWYFLTHTVTWAVGFALFYAAIVIDRGEFGAITIFGILILFVAVFFTSFLIIKRLHDLGYSGWLLLLNFLPFVSWVMGLFLLFAPGQPGPNKYGDPPGASPSNPSSAAANAEQLAGGRSRPASPRELEAVARANPEDMETWEKFYMQALNAGDTENLKSAGRHLIRLYLGAWEPLAALQCWSDLNAHNLPSSFADEFKLARHLIDKNYPTEGAAVLRSAAKKEVSPEQLLSFVRLAARADADLVRIMVDGNSQIDLLPNGERQEIERIRASLGPAQAGPEPREVSPPQQNWQDDPYAAPDSDPYQPFASQAVQVRAYVGVPESLEDTGMVLNLADGSRKTLPFHAIRAMGLGAIAQPSGNPMVVVGLVLVPLKNGTNQVVRVPVNSFNPAPLFPEAGSRREAFDRFIRTVQQRSGARPVPDMNALLGNPIGRFDSLEAFEASLIG